LTGKDRDRDALFAMGALSTDAAPAWGRRGSAFDQVRM
jgi:hypothetical protein